MISPQTLLPELFVQHPQTRPLFDSRGLRGCGGARGPNETIAFFARAHGVPLEALLNEVRDAIENPQSGRQAWSRLHAASEPGLADAIYRPFFITAILVALTMGALWGTVILLRIGQAGSYTAPSVFEVNAHGHGQIMGWVGLFIMGFGLQAFPRMWQVSLPAPALAWLTWLAAVTGMLLRSASLYWHESLSAAPMHLAGLVFQLLAISVFTGLLISAFLRSRQSWEPYLAFVFSSLAFMFLQTVYSGWHMDCLFRFTERDRFLEQIATYQAPLRDLQIHGMSLFMILGVGLRMFPAIFGFPEVPARRAWLAFGLLLIAVLLEVALFLAYRLTGSVMFAFCLLIPWMLMPIGVGQIVFSWRPWRSEASQVAIERSGKFVRIAFAWLFLGFGMLLFLPAYQVLSGIPFSHAYYGSIRHAITVGFVSMMIVGMGARVVPTLRGLASADLPSLWLPFLLLNSGCLVRVVFQIATDWEPMSFRLVAISGMMEWTGLALWGTHLASVMLGWGKYRQRVKVPELLPGRTLEGSEIVASVLKARPELESIFEQFGFRLIRNPYLRRTVATQVTLSQVCRLQGVSLEEFLNALNRRLELQMIQSSYELEQSDSAGETAESLLGGCNGSGSKSEEMPVGGTKSKLTLS